jgi:transcriptional regulator with XRE-family HTH domain
MAAEFKPCFNLKSSVTFSPDIKERFILAPMTRGARIRQIRKQIGLNQTEFGESVGVTPQAVSQWERGVTDPEVDRLQAIADKFAVSFDWLAGGKGEAPTLEHRPAADPQRPIPGDEMVGARDFPVYAAAMGGEGHLIVTFEQIETVKRPSILEGVRNAYALLISGDSMRPAFNHGDMALVHPGLPAARDKVHIFYDHPPFGEAGESEAMIKNLVGWTHDKWKLEQYNPAKMFDVDRIDWPTAHRVVGRYDAR